MPMPLWYLRQGESATALGSQRRGEAEELLRTRTEVTRAVTQYFQEGKTAEERIELFEWGLLKQTEEARHLARVSFQHGTASLRRCWRCNVCVGKHCWTITMPGSICRSPWCNWNVASEKHCRWGAWLFLAMILAGVAGCNSAQNDADTGKDRVPATAAGIVVLKPDVAAQAGIQVQAVQLADFQVSRKFPGTVQANQNRLAEITALVRGQVADVYADFGQEVIRGTVLARLHSTDLALAQSTYLKGKARRYVAEQAFERAKLLLEEKVIARAEHQRREGELHIAQSEVREARDRLQLLGMNEEAIAQLDRDKTIRSHVSLRAPFPGRIILRDVTVGEVVETAQKLFTVADLSDVWVMASIPEKDIQFIHQDQAVEVQVAAYPGKFFQGTITYVGDVLDPATRTVRLRVAVPNSENRLKPEMFATVLVHATLAANVLTVPVAATQRDQSGMRVFVQRDAEQFEARTVQLGEDDGETVTVLDGLREGELVVIKGAFVLKSELEKQSLGPAR